jgi:hypothetical protein
VLQQMRSAGITIPVIIFLTVLSDDIYEQAALEGGAVDFIDKARRLPILLKRLQLIAEGGRSVDLTLTGIQYPDPVGRKSGPGRRLPRDRTEARTRFLGGQAPQFIVMGFGEFDYPRSVGVAVPATRQNAGSPVFVVQPGLPVVQPGGVLNVPLVTD